MNSKIPTERDWRIDISFHTGFVTHSNDHSWQLGIDCLKGCPPNVEFFKDTERYIALGLWLDV
jgi:hypothetical protein